MSTASQKTSTSRNTLREATLKSPKPGHHLHLNKPLAGNGSNLSVNEMAPPSTPGIRAHLGHLLPRHALFHAKIMIHQISSVPFVGGEFGVRWKFKGIQAPHGQRQGLLDRVKSRNGGRPHSDKGKGREDGGVENMLSPTEPTDATIHRAPSSMHASSSVSSRSSAATHSQHLSVGWGSTPSSSSLLPSTNSSAVTLAPSTVDDTPVSFLSPSAVPASSTPARGITPYLKLKDHSVVWSQTLDPVLKFDIDRETHQVLPNPLKLVVIQRTNPDDPYGSPQNPRLGAVYLNLAEYINQGNVERRYLLKESKTNATLKISIEMEHIGGETHYIPPPLPKGEILGGIAGFLEKEVVKKRPRALDIFGPDQEELQIDLQGTPKSARIPKTAKSERKVSNLGTTTDTAEDGDEDPEESEVQDEEQVGVAFDVQRLPYAYGVKTTEMLIDALFNPAKTSVKHEESPFTIYEPPPPVPSSFSAGITPRAAASNFNNKPGPGPGLSGVPFDRNATIGKRQGSLTTESSSLYSTSDSSVHTSTSSSSRSRSRGTRGSVSDSHQGHSVTFAAAPPVPRGVPEGRVVVPPQQQHEDTSMGGLRAWWKRHKAS